MCIHKPLRDYHLIAHLKGNLTLGAYLLNQDSRTRYIVFDADSDEQKGQLEEMANSLSIEGVPSYLEISRRGGHLWIFFDWLVSGKDARAFGKGLSEIYALDEIELFPKQDNLSGGPGSLIRLPFGVHQKSGERYGFYLSNGEPIALTLPEQIHVLARPRVVSEEMYESYRAIGRSTPENREMKLQKATGETISQRIKSRITVYDFVGQYVELSPSGSGHCPFHDDQHTSFSVNHKENYWHCFAGCGGGSVIDFWMKWQGCDFPTSVKELTKMLNVT